MKNNFCANLYYRIPLIVFAIYMLLNACNSNHQQEIISREDNHSNSCDKKIAVNNAIGFSLTYENGYKLLYLINHYQKTKDTLPYLLIPAHHKIPDKYKNYAIIRIPVKKIITMSSTHIGLLNALDALDNIVGHTNTDHVYNKKISDRFKEGKIAEVGRDANLNTEVVLSMNPDVVISVGMQGQSRNAYTILEESGIPVIYNAEWQENSLLARAEWIKLMAALLCKEDLAEKKFNAISKSYDSLKNLTKSIDHQPLIMANSPIKGTWHVPGGNSYVANLIADAGGAYHWNSNTETGSFVVPFEHAFEVAAKADYWINVKMSGPYGSLADLDERLTDFPAYKKGNLYNFTNRVSLNGSNDYWESGIVHPDVILKDLIKIFHPGLLPDHSLYYYERIQK